jgi:hypothetical protein
MQLCDLLKALSARLDHARVVRQLEGRDGAFWGVLMRFMVFLRRFMVFLSCFMVFLSCFMVFLSCFMVFLCFVWGWFDEKRIVTLT